MKTIPKRRPAVVVGQDDPSLTPAAGLVLVAEVDRILGVAATIDSYVGSIKARRQGPYCGFRAYSGYTPYTPREVGRTVEVSEPKCLPIATNGRQSPRRPAGCAAKTKPTPRFPRTEISKERSVDPTSTEQRRAP